MKTLQQIASQLAAAEQSVWRIKREKLQLTRLEERLSKMNAPKPDWHIGDILDVVYGEGSPPIRMLITKLAFDKYAKRFFAVGIRIKGEKLQGSQISTYQFGCLEPNPKSVTVVARRDKLTILIKPT